MHRIACGLRGIHNKEKRFVISFSQVTYVRESIDAVSSERYILLRCAHAQIQHKYSSFSVVVYPSGPKLVAFLPLKIGTRIIPQKYPYRVLCRRYKICINTTTNSVIANGHAKEAEVLKMSGGDKHENDS